MCLILLSYDEHADYALVVAANRDEFYGRPTAPAAFWDDAPHVLAGRDLEAGGTWMGMTRSGRWAAVTNYRDRGAHKEAAPSRGRLVADYLQQGTAPAAYLNQLVPEADRYNGFNLLVGTPGDLGYYSNRDGAVRMLTPGLYGLSNHLLDTGWPKVERGRKQLRRLLEAGDVTADRLLDLLHDTTAPADEKLPDTGIGVAGERLLSPMFIESERYGTRSSTVLIVDRAGHVTFAERTYDREAAPETRRFAFDIESVPTDANHAS